METGCSGSVFIAPPTSLDQTLALGRIDRLFREGAQRLMFRTVASRVTKPDFSWSPYPEFTSPLTQDATGLALTWIGAVRPGTTGETRIGWGTDDLLFDRANPQIPLLSGPSGMLLPGSQLYYSYRNRTRNLETLGNLVLAKARNVLKLGGGLLDRRMNGYQTSGRDGTYPFISASDFAADRPFSLNLTISRTGPPELAPDYDREYRYRQWFGFFQGAWRAGARFNLNYGVRYERFGAPYNIGAVKDTVIALGTANTLAASIASATGYRTPAEGEQQLYDSDNRNWAGRAGFAYLLTASGRTIMRGAYGIFYDRPFDNLWQTLRHNSLQRGTVLLNGRQWNYLNPERTLPGPLNDRREIYQGVTLFQPGLRTPYAQSAFLGLRHLVTQNLSVELSAMNSLGRELMATDAVNRSFGRANTDLPDLSYRSNQGNSNYYAGAAVVTYRRRSSYIQAGYTWSHTIDNQSDALAGEYTDLGFAGSQAGQTLGQAAFSLQYDSRADRGNSDFDQRHNLVALGVVELPSPAIRTILASPLRDWRISWLAAARSGSPFTALANSILDIRNPRIINNRANVVDSARVYGMARHPGGNVLLNAAAFSQPRVGEVGNSGRNAFRGPGFWNVDFSLSRRIRIERLGEAGLVTVRADAFNLLNHANLGAPDSFIGSRSFGVALFGRQGYDTGFPALVPFRENARTVQLLLRVEF
jgi:hypothetical protein